MNRSSSMSGRRGTISRNEPLTTLRTSLPKNPNQRHPPHPHPYPHFLEDVKPKIGRQNPQPSTLQPEDVKAKDREANPKP